MAMETPWARGSFLVGIGLLLCCCPTSGRVKNSHSGEGTTNIESDVASSSRTVRQLLMPAFYPYTAGLVTNYQQRPPNFFDQWLRSNISTVSSDGKLFDETLPSARQQQQYPCGRGPATPPQRTTVGIVGGSEAVPNSWPFIVGLRKNGRAFCGGSLISPDKILTAAHCVEQLTSYDISVMTVSLGMHTVGDGEATKDDSQMTNLRVSKVVMHNGYSVVNGIPKAHDVAILIMESPVVYSDVISPVCLEIPSNDPDQYTGKDVTIIGWGRTKSDVGMSDTLQQATTQGLLSQFCKATMKGDSGGPLIVQSAAGAWTQVGIVSFGTTDCSGLSANTRVSAYKSWIINNM